VLGKDRRQAGKPRPFGLTPVDIVGIFLPFNRIPFILAGLSAPEPGGCFVPSLAALPFNPKKSHGKETEWILKFIWSELGT
jgi:hypothetical protein